MKIIDAHPRLARQGWFYIALTLFAVVLTTGVFTVWAGLLFWVIAGFVLQFFRDPYRAISHESGALVSPADGKDIVSVQVAGLVARRILCYAKEGDSLERGQRYGFIRFGSRVDLFLPVDFQPAVSLGDNVSAGSSILGHLR